MNASEENSEQNEDDLLQDREQTTVQLQWKKILNKKKVLVSLIHTCISIEYQAIGCDRHHIKCKKAVHEPCI